MLFPLSSYLQKFNARSFFFFFTIYPYNSSRVGILKRAPPNTRFVQARKFRKYRAKFSRTTRILFPKFSFVNRFTSEFYKIGLSLVKYAAILSLFRFRHRESFYLTHRWALWHTQLIRYPQFYHAIWLKIILSFESSRFRKFPAAKGTKSLGLG